MEELAREVWYRPRHLFPGGGCMKKKNRIRSILLAFLCCMMILGFQTEAKAAGNYYIKINKGTNVVTVYTNDNRPYTAFVCSCGYATPVGTFYTPNKNTWWLLDGPSWGQYVTQITGNYLFHSVWYFEQDKTTQSYVQYNKLGETASHGCVRLTTAAAKWIYDNCPLQTKVIVFNGTSADDPLGKPAAIKVSTSQSMGWDPTDPDTSNPYKTKNTQPRISVKSHSVSLQYRSKFTPVEMTAYDSAGNALSGAWIRSSGSVNTNQMGSYPVTYSVTDSFGRNASTTVTYKVGDVSKAVLSGVRTEVRREYNSVYDLRSGITAKNTVYGTNLTDKIQVKIRKPGEKEYKSTKAKELKLRKTGNYKIMYSVTNPTNKFVTTKYTVVASKDTKKPVFTSEDKFAKIVLTAGTQSVTFKKLLSGVSANLVSGKNMRSKISIKVTAPGGKTKTVAKDGSYKLSGTGTYTVTYYCTNPEKNKATGTYRVAKKSRKLVVDKPRVKAVKHVIQIPRDTTVTTGTSLQILKYAKVVTTTTMTDKTKKQSETTKGIQYTVAYQAKASAKPETVTVKKDVLVTQQEGIYTITYRYADKQGNRAERVRTVTVTANENLE